MPTYEYDCAQCGSFTALCAMDARNVPKICPSCGDSAPRITLTAPAFAGMPPANRAAYAINERAAHEPRLSAGHGAGCTCCSGGRAAGTARSADGLKAFPARRPWMISH